MLIKIIDKNMYILEQQHKNPNSVNTDFVKSVDFPEVRFENGSIVKIYIQGNNSRYDKLPLICNTLQNLNTVIRHLSDWCSINNEPLHIRLNHRTCLDKIDDNF